MTMTAASTPKKSAKTKPIPFNLLLCIEGYETSDGRMFELGSTTWRELPIPFMVQDTSPHGPGQMPGPAWAAGQVEEIYRDETDPSRIMGRGHFMPNETGQRGAEILQHAFRGVSVDAYGTNPAGPNLQPTHVDATTGDPLAVLVRFSDNVISRVTMVPTPALEPCCAWLDTEEMPEIAANAHGSLIADVTEPEAVVRHANTFEHLVAAGGGPLNPPRSWFFTSEPDHYQPIEVTPEGHLTGHIARAGQCYLNDGTECRTAPMSSTVPPYKAFHRTVARCDDGTEVACGWLTMGTKHSPDLARLSPGQVADQYDHTGTLGAKIRCSNGVHGVWASGAVLPGLEDRELAIIQGPEVSGDWRRWQDPDDGAWHSLELLGVLGVPFPAFPGTRIRPELLVASGGPDEATVIVGQIGQMLPCDDEEESFGFKGKKAPPFKKGGKKRELAADEDEIAAIAARAFDLIEDGVEFDPTVPLSVQERARYFSRYDEPARSMYAANGFAMRDGTFVIADVADLRDAIRDVYASGGSAPLVMYIIQRAEALGRVDMLPDPDGETAFYVPVANPELVDLFERQSKAKKAEKERSKAEYKAGREKEQRDRANGDKAVLEVKRQAAKEGRKPDKNELNEAYKRATGGPRQIEDKIRQRGQEKEARKEAESKGDGSWDEDKHPRNKDGEWENK